MAHRLIEITVSRKYAEEAREVLQINGVEADLDEPAPEGCVRARLLVDADSTSAIIDLAQRRFSGSPGFRLLLLSVEAALPRHSTEDVDEATAEDVGDDDRERPRAVLWGLSREELIEDIDDMAKTSGVFIAMVVLSSIVAAIALQRGSVAVLVGAMVIAPLLGPNVALAFAAALGDLELLRRAMKAHFIGVSLAIAIGVAIGFVLPVDPGGPAIAERTQVSLADILLALASGCAGVLALGAGAAATLVGVMVAVALMPPALVMGLLCGAGEWEGAYGAMLLLATNVICVNLAGVVTFLVQGVQPLHWWEAQRARSFARRAITLWAILLVSLVLLILSSGL